LKYLPVEKALGVANVVSVTTRYRLDGRWFEPCWATYFTFPIPLQTGPRAHSASSKMNTGALPQGQSDWDLAVTTHLI